MAYKLEGDAYRQEGKADQALLAYNIALQDNEDDLDYLTVLEARGDLYFDQRRYDLAIEDYDAYLAEDNEPAIRLKHMLSAYNMGDYQVALADVRRLDGTRVISNGDLTLIRGRILIDTAENRSDYEEALLQALNQAVITLGVSEDNDAIANEYLARANLELENYEQALVNIDRALLGDETGTRHFLKGQILQALEDYVGARDEYAFIIAWSEIFTYPFINDVYARYEEVLDLIANPPAEDDA